MKFNILTGNTSNRNILVYFIFLTISIASLQTVLLPKYNFKSEKLAYLHYHFIKVLIDEKLKDIRLTGKIYFNNKQITTIGNQDLIKFRYDKDIKQYVGKFPVPWGAKEGLYSIVLFENDEPLDWDDIFYIKTRIPPVRTNDIFKIVNLESTRKINRFRVTGPDGKKGSYEKIYEWIKYIGGNTLWYLAGQTASYKPDDIEKAYPWVSSNLSTLKKFSKEAKMSGLNFGAWISCYRIFGKASLKPQWYQYSYKYKSSKDIVYETNGISILDIRRLQDIINLVKEFNKIESIDHIGLDYIRPAGGGLELVDEFVEIMEIEVPYGWDKYSKNERMKWLGRIVTRTKNRGVPLIDKWNWWRASRVSQIINMIKRELDPKKTLWSFVLTWELGHQHGQDPIMFQDAGIDLIAVMMYETDAPRFDHMIKEWKDYLDGVKINIVPGNQIDWVLHQYTVFPSGPVEYSRRLQKSIDTFKEINTFKGLFVNDFVRLVGGRLGPYTSREWFMVVSKLFSGLIIDPAVSLEIEFPEIIAISNVYNGKLVLKNISNDNLTDIEVSFPDLKEVIINSPINKIDRLKPFESKTIPFTVTVKNADQRRMGRYMVSANIQCNGKKYNEYKYFWVKDSVDIGEQYR